MYAAASGTLLSKITEEAHRLSEERSANNCQWPSERSLVKKVVDIHKVDPIVSLSAQVSALANQITTFTTKESASKEAAMVTTTSYTGEGLELNKSSASISTTKISTTAPTTYPLITILP